MDKQTKEELIKSLHFIHDQIGKQIQITDWLSTRGPVYDRHWTRYNRYTFKLEDFAIRTSGAIASIRGASHHIEFRTDCIKSLTITQEQITYEINLADRVWRKLLIDFLVDL